MTDSYAQFQVHYGTEQRYKQLVAKGRQRVEIPASWVSSHSGGYRLVIRTVHVMGTVETEHYGRKRVEYGRCVYEKYVVIVVDNGSSWKAIERRDVNGCIA